MCDVFYHDNISFIFKLHIHFVLECVAKKTKSLFEYNTTIHNGVVLCNDIISDIFERLHVKDYTQKLC